MENCSECRSEMIFDGFGHECPNGCEGTDIVYYVETYYICPNCKEETIKKVDSREDNYKCSSCFQFWSKQDLEELE